MSIIRPLNIAFQMDDITKINLESDTTFFILEAAFRRGHNLLYYTPNSLSLKEDIAVAKVQKIEHASYNNAKYVSLGNPTDLALDSLDLIWIRQDPPFDMAYLYTTYVLEFVYKHNKNTLVVNPPQKVRDFPEKIFAHHFKNFTPKTILTRDQDIIKSFLQKHKKAILKPLFEAKGDDIHLLSENDPKSFVKIANMLAKYKEALVLQEFLPNVSQGDKRVFIIDGEPLGVMNRIPPEGSITSNLAKGGTAAITKLTPRELEIATTVGKILKKEGLFFAGIDLIDNHLTEINLTSPTGLKTYHKLTGVDLTTSIWDKLEGKLLHLKD